MQCALKPVDAKKVYVQDAKVEGNTIRFWTVQADGSPADEGKARRIQ
jgi:hypothetical protein